MNVGRVWDAQPPREILVVDGGLGLWGWLRHHLDDIVATVTLLPDAGEAGDRAAVSPSAAIVLDLGGDGGLERLEDLARKSAPAPLFAVCAQASVRLAVRAIQAGAADFFEKPGEMSLLLNAVRLHLGAPPRGPTMPALPGALPPMAAGELTPREREVLGHIAAGASNKEVGRRLAISPRTVEVHRARIMDKLGARNTADLVRIALLAPRA